MIHEIHESAATLLAKLGQPIFEPLTNAAKARQSCSIAKAMALLGRSANGWVEWKAANGKTLDELKRQTVAAVG